MSFIPMTDDLDCLVIGGGPAGLTAAIYLGRFRRRVHVIDKGWSRAEWISKSHNLPGFPDGLAGPVLLEALRAQAQLYGATLETGTVDSLQRDNDKTSFTAKVGASILTARTVLLATGVIENKPPVPHLADAVKSGLIRTCPICDGFESRGKRLAVLGNGEHAAAEALYLRTYTDQLTLLLSATDTRDLSEKTRLALQTAGIEIEPIATGSVTLEADGVTALSMEDGQVHRFDAVYSAFGTTSQTQLVTALDARLDAAQRVFVDAHQATSVTGLYAAGDVVRGLNQISVAEGEAAIAATAIHNLLPQVFA
jgi:thioredoxin reductase (NADPH)